MIYPCGHSWKSQRIVSTRGNTVVIECSECKKRKVEKKEKRK
jgi:hypothetical protein